MKVIHFAMKTFTPGDYIVTSEGYRGYVIEQVEGVRDMYVVRLASGYTVRHVNNLQSDQLMEEVAV